MGDSPLLPHLFRTEFRKIVAVLSRLFGLSHIEIAEDLASETFLLAAETWGKKGIPEQPTAWLYTVAKNKAKDYLKRNQLFNEKIMGALQQEGESETSINVDLSKEHIQDSELQMLFAVCHPAIPVESQIGLALRVLFGFGIEEIADAFLSNKETINKRLHRAKEKLRENEIKMEMPPDQALSGRLASVCLTLYLLFNEGYYSNSSNSVLKKEVCLQALQLTYLLTAHPKTNTPEVNALIALMCFHASRIEARLKNNEIVLLEEQDTALWNQELIQTGQFYLNQSAKGEQFSKYHLEAGIAFWHTQPDSAVEKWPKILSYYNYLLQMAYSPIAAMNRTYALYKNYGAEKALEEALKLSLTQLHWYHALLGFLYQEIDLRKAKEHWNLAKQLAKSDSEKTWIDKRIAEISNAKQSN